MCAGSSVTVPSRCASVYGPVKAQSMGTCWSSSMPASSAKGSRASRSLASGDVARCSARGEAFFAIWSVSSSPARSAAVLPGQESVMAETETAATAFDEVRRDARAGNAKGASRSLLKSVGPRLLRDILGPTLSFYLGWKLTGSIVVGVVLGTAFSVTAWRYERRRGRPGVIARFVLAIVVIQAIVGLATGSATAYLIQPAVLGAINGA